MVMEDVFQLIETPETSTMRINAEAMNHIGAIFLKADDKEMKQELFKMLQSHSKFLLETSEKVIQNRRLHIKSVK